MVAQNYHRQLLNDSPIHLPTKADKDKCALQHISLINKSVISYARTIQRERDIAIHDLYHGNVFQLINDTNQHYYLEIENKGRFLSWQLTNAQNSNIHDFEISLSPLRRPIRDYYTICESYYEAAGRNHISLQTIDMARRALHNEGADILMSLLEPHAKTDHDTARRLFTLISVLSLRLSSHRL